MGGVTSSIFGQKPKGASPMASAQFQPFTYTSIGGTVEGKRDGDSYNFSSTIDPRFESLYGSALDQAQPFLSQYLTEVQQPVERFGFDQGIEEAQERYFRDQQDVLNPIFQAEREQLQSDLFGSGRLGLQIGGVNPDAAGLAEAQASALVNARMQARQAANAEQAQAFSQASDAYRFNNAAQQQRLANLMGGFSGAFGTAQDVLGIESGLVGQAAGLEQARAGAQAASAQAGLAMQPRGGSGGLFGAIGAGAGSYLGKGAGSWLGGKFGFPTV